MHETTAKNGPDGEKLKAQIQAWGQELGFQQVGVSDLDLSDAESRLEEWLAREFHGEMGYMSRHGTKRSRPEELIPGTLSVVSVRMDYLPENPGTAEQLLDHPDKAYISRYALGRDYHKVLRGKLRKLAKRIEAEIGPHGHRVFVDSAPVLEKPIAEKAGLGWIGKHTNLINKDAGSWFFLGELYVDFPLPADALASGHCGSCTACIDVCPTGAIIGPYQLDARRCISYLTIELKGAIPEEYRKLIGNRIYGCDDCQLFCPWNKFATRSDEQDFAPRHGFDAVKLKTLFAWSEEEWLEKTEGSAMRRIGFEQWSRNLAVALGNAEYDEEILAALEAKTNTDSQLVNDHVEWALAQQKQKQGQHV